MGFFVMLALLAGLAATGTAIAISFGFYIFSSALTRQPRYTGRFLTFGIAGTVIAGVLALGLFDTGGGAPSGEDYVQWVSGGFLLGVAPAIGFALGAIAICALQTVARFREDLSKPADDNLKRALGLLVASVPLAIILLVAGASFFEAYHSRELGNVAVEAPQEERVLDEGYDAE